MRELRLRRAGGSIVTTIPKVLAERQHLEVGDRILAVETENGILLTPTTLTWKTALRLLGERRRSTAMP
jgi:antitoxin component of MazEF toxin-antitoxin module